MKDLNAEQKACVGSWVEEGMGLSDIQKRLKDDLDIGLTFMDVRFLVSDLKLQLKSEDKKKPELDDTESDSHDTVPSDRAFDNPDMLDDEGSVGVTVEVDKVVRPGAAASGSVTFRDGKKAGWHVDQFGQLGLVPPEEGYQPTEEDLQAFQMELRNAMQRSSF
jgi:hypothetical protein